MPDLSARFCSPRSDPQSFAIDMRIPYVGLVLSSELSFRLVQLLSGESQTLNS